jgi:twitching motility protein PilJ
MIDNLNSVKWLPVLMGALGLMLLLSLLTAYMGNRAAGDRQTRMLNASLLNERLDVVGAAATRAGGGDDAGYQQLAELKEQVASVKGRLAGAGIEAGTSSDWQAFDAAIERLLIVQEQVQRLQADVDQAIAEAGVFVTAMQRMSATLLGSRWQSQREGLERAAGTSNSIIQTMEAYNDGQLRIVDFRPQIDAAAAGLADEVEGLLADEQFGGQAADEVRLAYQNFEPVLRVAAEAIAARVETNSSLIDLAAATDRLRGQVNAAVSAAGPVGGLLASSILHFIILAAALAFLVGLAVLYFSNTNAQRVAEDHALQNERNQKAILKLLDELGTLADGDLTVQATVTEHITGAIADSINYAIEALRNLVTTIRDSSILVDAAARQSEATISHLAAASETQAQQVGSATESIAHMANSVEEVSGNAERAADVARHSVDVAHKGGDAVRRTIEGMNTIRETIQDTSKRIKRLGESSQEIGNIVELINDIAEQTNILALNASIQASMAGEAGRGFAVVADEVQRLAERSANATKQIEVLVRTIQSDTNEAVVSMERSTTDVVGGALLAENAGAALEEIEQVSNQIASLVQNISGSARQQSLVAADISRNTGVLREISEQTAESTSATSDSIRKLAELATQLRRSVADFRLPDDETESERPPEQKPAARKLAGEPDLVDALNAGDDRDEAMQV